MEIILVKLLGILFFGMGVYGLLAGRIYGRSWKKYWGGWIYRQDNPYIYWLYIFMYFVVALAMVYFLVLCRF